MSLFNSFTRGFGMSLGYTAAKKITNSSIDQVWKFCWGFIKIIMIVVALVGFLQGLLG